MASPGDRDLLTESLQKIRALRAELAARDAALAARARTPEPIAIVGAACRFPGGADTLDAYWQLLVEGRDAIREVPAGRWNVDAFFDADPETPGKSYVRHGGFLEDVSGFDAEFFGIAPREAEQLDPQQRLLLEVAWEALEDAAVAPDSLRGSATGVYIGVMSADYALRQAHDLDARCIDPYMLSGNDLSFAAGRVAHVLGLQGPVMAVSTACSSSLVSVHLAVQALRAGECDLAIAGGVNLVLDPVTNVMLSKLRAVSADGRCRTFDASASGYGRGEGCGLVVLAPLSVARARGARILAVIRGSAVNHDGPSAGLTVPNGSAQEQLLRRAWQVSGIEPSQLGYVEAHGTGTPLGDPIELGALAAARGAAPGALLVGSVKTNIGHLEAAAGVASLIKVVLALGRGVVPPHLHFETPNPRVAWDALPLRVPAVPTPLPAGALAGVSAFGLSGVNAHVVLEAPPGAVAAAPLTGSTSDRAAGRRRVLPISARSAAALEALVTRYDAWLAAHDDANWEDVCFTAITGRAHFEHRTAVVAASAVEARLGLRTAPRRRVVRRGRVSEADPDRAAAQYLDGALLDWAPFEPSACERRPVSLPTYAFQRRRYWALDDRGPAHGDDDGDGHLSRSTLHAATIEEAIEAVLGLPREFAAYGDRSLLELGLDSLMALELRTWSQARGIDLELATLLSAVPARVVAEQWTQATAAGTVPPAAAGATAARYPLSSGQRALWFVHQSAPGSAAYNVGIGLRMRSSIDLPRLTAAFQAVVDRHHALRSVIADDAGTPVQEVLPRVAITIARHDAASLDDQALRARVEADYARPFDLTAAPLLRLSWYERGPADAVLLLTLHHLICDATSCWTLLDEVHAHYAGAPLPPAPASYADYVASQRELLAGAEGERLWSYWRERLAGELPVLDLPLDRPRPAIPAYAGRSVRRTVPAALAQRLRTLSRTRGATLYALLLASYQALLHRYTGQTEVIVGSASLGRPSGFAGTVGYFVNVLPIRSDAAGDPPFETFLDQVKQRALEALAHEQFPFAVLVERLQPKRDSGRPPIVQADFALSREATAYRPGLGVAAAAFAIERFEFGEEEGQFDLGLHVTELPSPADADAGELVARFKYDAALFDAATVERLADAWLTLLDGVVRDPACRLSALPILSAAEREETLALGRGPVRDWPFAPLTRLVADQARRSPEAIAIETVGDASGSLTYAALQCAVARTAARLRRAGIHRGSLVAVALPRTPNLAVSLLAVLETGAAYLPIDPTYPRERVTFMQEDAGASLLVTVRDIAPHVTMPGIPTLLIDENDETDPSDSNDSNDSSSPDDVAYVIYTSGSTGRPKGTCLTHGGLMNYLSWAAEAYDVAAGAGAPINSSIGFDATITALFLPLMTGGRVVLLPETHTIEALAGVLAEGRGFSLVKITPAHLELLAHTLPAEAHASAARALVIGGEALRGELLAQWQAHAPGVRLFNEYGPTETVVGCCVQEVDEPASGAVPIGRPIANTRLYVLDERRQLVPVGVVGELYISGTGVGVGYLNRPELTRERFLEDPFAGGSARMYRTGDFVRLRNNGVFEYLGRRDGQVKIRGHRVELGEIEAVLGAHASVADAAVTIRTEAGGPRLAAYVVPRGEVDRAGLRRYLAEQLPEVMRPSSLTVVSALPLTPNGKIDRAALPVPDMPAPEAFTRPRDTLEMALVAIWEELLDTRPLGVRDDFFERGGHSLLAVRLMARVREAFGVDMPLADILRAPTVERLADRLRGQRPRPASSLVPIQPAGTAPPFFCVPGAGGNTLYFYNLARQLGDDQPFFGVQGVGFDGEAAPHRTVDEMAAHAVAEIRTRQPHGPYAIGGHSLGAWVAFEAAQRLIAAGEAVSTLAVIDTPVPHPAAFRDTEDWDQARWIIELADRIARLLDPDLRVSLEALRAVSDAEQLELFRAALQRTQLFPGAAGATHLRHALALFRAHAAVRYTLPPRPVRTRLTLLRTAAPPPHLAAVAGDPTWGWSAVADVEVHVVPGDHLAVLRPPHVATLAERLRGALRPPPR